MSVRVHGPEDIAAITSTPPMKQDAPATKRSNPEGDMDDALSYGRRRPNGSRLSCGLRAPQTR